MVIPSQNSKHNDKQTNKAYLDFIAAQSKKSFKSKYHHLCQIVGEDKHKSFFSSQHRHLVKSR